MSESKTSPHVLVIGAGSTGLLIAQGLKRAGISCHVYERVDADTYKHRQRDWTMALHWGSEFLETCLPPHLLDRLKEAEADPSASLTDEQEHFLPFYSAITGERISMVPTKSTRRISREKFRKLASQGVDIRYNSKVVDIKRDGDVVTACFEDGHTATGDVLIGCDSANSFVRSYLLGPEKAACETVPVPIYNFTCSYSADQAIFIRNSLHPLTKFALHHKLSTFYMLNIAHIGDPDDPTTWIFQNLVTRGGPSDTDDSQTTTPEARLAHFKSIGSQFCEPWRSAASGVKDDQYIHQDKLTHWPNAIPWDNHGGRITLAGDAAHPMLPCEYMTDFPSRFQTDLPFDRQLTTLGALRTLVRGQGFNNGLEDAARYVKTLKQVFDRKNENQKLGGGEDDIRQALKLAIDEYDAEVFDRGSKEIKLSYEQVRSILRPEEFKSSPVNKYGMNKVT